MTGPRTAAGLALGALFLGCSGDAAVRDQWRIAIATDAPVPALANRLLVEVLNERGELACAGCTRLFGLDATTKWPVSFGVIEPARPERLWVQARLFRDDHAGSDGRPSGAALIDALAGLPEPSGVTDLALVLSMGCYAVPSDPTLAASCSDASGVAGPTPTLAPSSAPLPETGSWPPARAQECPEAAPDGMVCVPGGVFMLGDVRLSATSAEAAIERLTRVDAFAIDRDEMTVARARARLTESGWPERPTSRGERACVYTSAPDPTSDSMPLNCVSFALAAKLCELEGKRLPTEAEWEYAAGSLSEERFVPWGALDTACEDAILGRGRTLQEGGGATDLSTACRVAEGRIERAGPVAGGNSRDVTSIGVLNMGGNLTEFTLGAALTYDAPCYGEGRVAVNPDCPPDGVKRSTRGGHWAMPVLFAATAQRGTNLRGEGDSFTGLRCVKPYGRP